MNKRLASGAVATATLLALGLAVPGGPASAAPGEVTEYTVVAEDGVSTQAAIGAITAAGGRVTGQLDTVGMFQVSTDRADFTSRVAANPALAGAVARRPIGTVPRQKFDPARESAPGGAAAAPTASATTSPGPDPLDDKLWGLAMVRAATARATEAGDRRVTVGVIDSGLDASNPDLAANFDAGKSRNFAPDMVDIDGPCEVPSCLDPIGTDDNGHGTHVAGTIGAAANGVGLSGVAPNVTLVELKAGQDSGFVFLNPVIQALVHAANIGIDVVNMSFYVDPWLYNCVNNPADSPQAQAEQRATIRVMRRALNYAHLRGVTLVGSLGNNHEDLGNPRIDRTSPDYGPIPPYDRTIDNATCFDLPIEGPHVIGTSALGPSTRKADYSNYGTEQISVSAPGGWFRDGIGTPTYRTDGNQILSTYPLRVLQLEGRVDAAGNIVAGFENSVFKSCTASGQCGYYAYLQGTSMAAPHVSGVAALIVSKFGFRDFFRGGNGLTLPPSWVENQLLRTAAEHACPEPRLETYVPEGRSLEFDAFCAGDENFNGFYGYGIVDAHAAVNSPLQPWVNP